MQSKCFILRTSWKWVMNVLSTVYKNVFLSHHFTLTMKCTNRLRVVPICPQG